MTRITACPQCKTRFRVTAEQLAAHGGDVRCGRCNHVFNAYRTLAEEAPPAEIPFEIEYPDRPPEPTPEEPPAATIGAAPEDAEATQALPEQPQQEAEESQPNFVTEDLPGEEENPALPATSPEVEPEPEAAPEVRVVRVQPPPLKVEPNVSPERPKYGPPPKPKRAWPWALGSLVFLAGLLLQGVYFQRDSIAANYPPTRPLLEQACSYLQCRISLPRNPDLISIESSDLHADPARANIVVLTSVLRNRAPHVQAYPALELTLTNTRDEMVARRIFAAREYVPQGTSLAQGIPPKGEVAVKLLLDLGTLKAEGYRIYLFYPE